MILPIRKKEGARTTKPYSTFRRWIHSLGLATLALALDLAASVAGAAPALWAAPEPSPVAAAGLTIAGILALLSGGGARRAGL